MSPKTREIIERAARANDVTIADVLSPSQTRDIVKARRQIARELRAADKSLPDIGRILNRDPSSIFHLLKTETPAPSKLHWKSDGS